MFQPILLLNTLKKLIEKVINNRLQNQYVVLNFIYSNQIGRLKHCLTTDIGIFYYKSQVLVLTSEKNLILG